MMLGFNPYTIKDVIEARDIIEESSASEEADSKKSIPGSPKKSLEKEFLDPRFLEFTRNVFNNRIAPVSDQKTIDKIKNGQNVLKIWMEAFPEFAAAIEAGERIKLNTVDGSLPGTFQRITKVLENFEEFEPTVKDVSGNTYSYTTPISNPRDFSELVSIPFSHPLNLTRYLRSLNLNIGDESLEFYTSNPTPDDFILDTGGRNPGIQLDEETKKQLRNNYEHARARGDCVTTAIAIAMGLAYNDLWHELKRMQQRLPKSEGFSISPDLGIEREIFESFLSGGGWMPLNLSATGLEPPKFKDLADILSAVKGAEGKNLSVLVANEKHIAAIKGAKVRDRYSSADMPIKTIYIREQDAESLAIREVLEPFIQKYAGVNLERLEEGSQWVSTSKEFEERARTALFYLISGRIKKDPNATRRDYKFTPPRVPVRASSMQEYYNFKSQDDILTSGEETSNIMNSFKPQLSEFKQSGATPGKEGVAVHTSTKNKTKAAEAEKKADAAEAKAEKSKEEIEKEKTAREKAQEIKRAQVFESWKKKVKKAEGSENYFYQDISRRGPYVAGTGYNIREGKPHFEKKLIEGVLGREVSFAPTWDATINKIIELEAKHKKSGTMEELHELVGGEETWNRLRAWGKKENLSTEEERKEGVPDTKYAPPNLITHGILEALHGIKITKLTPEEKTLMEKTFFDVGFERYYNETRRIVDTKTGISGLFDQLPPGHQLAFIDTQFHGGLSKFKAIWPALIDYVETGNMENLLYEMINAQHWKQVKAYDRVKSKLRMLLSGDLPGSAGYKAAQEHIDWLIPFWQVKMKEITGVKESILPGTQKPKNIKNILADYRKRFEEIVHNLHSWKLLKKEETEEKTAQIRTDEAGDEAYVPPGEFETELRKALILTTGVQIELLDSINDLKEAIQHNTESIENIQSKKLQETFVPSENIKGGSKKTISGELQGKFDLNFNSNGMTDSRLNFLKQDRDSADVGAAALLDSIFPGGVGGVSASDIEGLVSNPEAPLRDKLGSLVLAGYGKAAPGLGKLVSLLGATQGVVPAAGIAAGSIQLFKSRRFQDGFGDLIGWISGEPEFRDPAHSDNDFARMNQGIWKPVDWTFKTIGRLYEDIGYGMQQLANSTVSDNEANDFLARKAGAQFGKKVLNESAVKMGRRSAKDILEHFQRGAEGEMGKEKPQAGETQRIVIENNIQVGDHVIQALNQREIELHSENRLHKI